MHYVKIIVVGFVAWQLVSLMLLAVFGSLYEPEYSTAYKFVGLPVGLWIGWWFANRKR